MVVSDPSLSLCLCADVRVSQGIPGQALLDLSQGSPLHQLSRLTLGLSLVLSWSDSHRGPGLGR